MDYLQDILWAYSDDWTWVMAAHEYAAIDLGSAMRGARLAEILYALKKQIEPEVTDRVHEEIKKRLFYNIPELFERCARQDSGGHSVPLINGREQKEGARYRGDLSVEGFNEEGVKKIVIDMARAYPRGTVHRLIRTLELDAAANSLTIVDDYRFSKKPKALEEAFVTYEKSVVNGKGDEVRIGPVRGGASLWPPNPERSM